MDTERIEQLRKQRGLTQQQAAERAKIGGRQHWNNMVKRRNNITVTQLEDVAKALGVTAADLLTTTAKPRRPR